MTDGSGADRFGGNPQSSQAGETTGRYIVVFHDDVSSDPGGISQALQSMAGVSDVASSLDFEGGALDVEQAASADATVFAELGLAVVSSDPERADAIVSLADTDPRIRAVEPERILHAIDERPVSLDYIRGFRDGVTDLYGRLSGADLEAAGAGVAQIFLDSAASTWGLQATAAFTSSRTAQGIPLAVLDTGFDLKHPDFAGRQIVNHSFVQGLTAQDGHGHGTHCVGTSCGPKTPPGGSRRYGVATKASIFVGKVLNDQGSGTDGNILAGINWAVANKVRVISMSLGADVAQVSAAYEQAGQKALNAGCLIVAAAGNNAHRSSGIFGFVGIPANSPSIMAVAAVDNRLHIADFSARSNPVPGGRVDIAGPGVAVYSSWPMPTRYNTISGTSMATPHVAGVAALLSQATGAVGGALWAQLLQTAQALPAIASVDVGAGLVKAPQ